MQKISKGKLIKIIMIAVALILISAFLIYRAGGIFTVNFNDRPEIPIATEENTIHFSNAPENVGKTLWVRGLIDHVFISANDNYFLNFCPDFRQCPFSAPIFSEDAVKFEDIGSWSSREVYIYGMIETYEGRPQIIIKDPEQIIILGDDADEPLRDDQGVEIINVIDGDTIWVKMEGYVEPVRLIGIDAPEIDGPYSDEECYGPESANQLRELLEGKRVSLEKDDLSPDRDVHDRMLRYVYLPDDLLVNAWMIEEGHAFFYERGDFLKRELFMELESLAREGRKGLWGDICEYHLR